MNISPEVINKDGKVTIALKQTAPSKLLVGFEGTNITKEYSIKDYMDGKTSDVVKVTGGKTFTQVHLGEIRTMGDGLKGTIIRVLDEEKTLVGVQVEGSSKLYEVAYADFYKGSIYHNRKYKEKGVTKTEQTFDDVLEAYIKKNNLKFIKPTGVKGEYTLFGKTIRNVNPQKFNGKFSLVFDVAGGVSRTNLDKAIAGIMRNGNTSPYFQDALQADRYITGGYYTEQFWLKAAADYRAGNPLKGVNTNCREFQKAVETLGTSHAYVVPGRPVDKADHPLYTSSMNLKQRGAGKAVKATQKAYHDLYGIGTSPKEESSKPKRRTAADAVRDTKKAYHDLYGMD